MKMREVDGTEREPVDAPDDEEANDRCKCGARSALSKRPEERCRGGPAADGVPDKRDGSGGREERERGELRRDGEAGTEAKEGCTRQSRRLDPHQQRQKG